MHVTMMPDTDFSVWLAERQAVADRDTLDAAARELGASTSSGHHGASQQAIRAARRLQRVEAALASLPAD